MALGHRATASPLALCYGWALHDVAGVNGLAAVGCAALVVMTSTIPDWDHPRFKGRMHPGAALVRATGHLGYRIRTASDVEREDLHRGPSHCIEWCLLAGLAVGLLALRIPAMGGHALWLGLAVTIGTVSHIAADVCTPSGVPICATYNYFVHGEVWKRHSLALFTTDSAGEKFLAVPALFGLTGVLVLGMLGLLGPAMTAVTGFDLDASAPAPAPAHTSCPAPKSAHSHSTPVPAKKGCRR